ncbi:hypothetical protein TCAL_16027 [Tigriopus californicus]|uniref:RING-type domain-containing protein n=1 Tax=Tigriopus californicus TaxID=6832 RepID=A0A553PP89_TIGCA|nr:hypothetical protein TCAL_16027 [Tigriopus californicus]
MEQFDQLLTCCICLDRFRTPKLLPCQHSYCMEPCMEGLVDYVKRQVKCPECRAEHRIPYDGIQQFPTNYTLQKFLELHSEITGELPDLNADAVMSRCNVCSEKAYVSNCAHCDKKVCDECKNAHCDVLKREICRINNQIKRGWHRLEDCLEQVERNQTLLTQNANSVLLEVDEIQRRLANAIKERTDHLKNNVEKYLTSEMKTLKDLKVNLELELTNIQSNSDLMEKHLEDDTKWDDNELMDCKEIFLKMMDFIRNFDAGAGSEEFSRRIRLTTHDCVSDLSKKILELGDLKLHETKIAPPEDDFSTRSTGLSRSKSDHRLVADFRRREEAGERSPPSRRRFGDTRYSRDENKSRTNFGRYNLADDDEDDGSRNRNSGGRFRSRFLRNDDDDDFGTTSTSSTRRTETNEEDKAGKRNRVLDTEDASRGPLSGCIRLADSSRIIQRLKEMEMAKIRAKRIKDNPPPPPPPVQVRPKPPSQPLATPAQPQEDEIDKIKRENKEKEKKEAKSTATAVVDPPVAAPEPLVTFATTTQPPPIVAPQRPSVIAPVIPALPTVAPTSSILNEYTRPNYPIEDSTTAGRRSKPRESSSSLVDRYLAQSRGPTASGSQSPSIAADSQYPSGRSRYAALRDRQSRLARSKSSALVGLEISDESDADDDRDNDQSHLTPFTSKFGGELARSRSSHMLKGGSASASSQGASNGATAAAPPNSQTKGDDTLSSWAKYLKSKYGKKSAKASSSEPLSHSMDRGAAAMHPLTLSSQANQQRQDTLLTFGGRGGQTGMFTWPRGIAVGPGNSIVVADSSNHRVQVFKENGTYSFSFGSYGNGEGEFDCLAGVAVNRIGQYIIADRYNHRIQIFDPSGTFLRAFGSQGSSDGKFSYPWGITTDALGFIYVCDKENHRVQVFQSDGTFVGKFGSLGTQPGQFEHPHYIAVSSTNRVIVSDSNNHRIQIFDISGKIMTTFGTEGTSVGQFKFPRGVAVDDQGFIYVADSGNNRIQIFNPDGTFVRLFGRWGSGEAEFKGLEGIAVNQNGNILVADRENHRVQLF